MERLSLERRGVATKWKSMEHHRTETETNSVE
nr:MAG TPA: hypothetical protein [Caudoviricetes sp.]DAP23911.1 MAG TPA: hypothetical protein [Caudoviricetes sp.]